MTSMPMLRAVPAIMRMAASSLLALRSAFLSLMISMICFLVTLPTLSELGLAEPEAMPAAFFRRTAAGGDLQMKVKDLSEKTVMTTGMIIPLVITVFS